MDKIEVAARESSHENMSAFVVPVDQSPQPQTDQAPPSPLWVMYKEQYESGIHKKVYIRTHVRTHNSLLRSDMLFKCVYIVYYM